MIAKIGESRVINFEFYTSGEFMYHGDYCVNQKKTSYLLKRYKLI